MQTNIRRCVRMIRMQLYYLHGQFKYLFIVDGRRFFSFVNKHMHVLMVWKNFMNNEEIISLIFEGMPSITLFFLSIPFPVVHTLSVQQHHQHVGQGNIQGRARRSRLSPSVLRASASLTRSWQVWPGHSLRAATVVATGHRGPWAVVR